MLVFCIAIQVILEIHSHLVHEYRGIKISLTILLTSIAYCITEQTDSMLTLLARAGQI